MAPIYKKLVIWALRYALNLIGVGVLWRLRKRNYAVGSFLLLTLFQGLCCTGFLLCGGGIGVVIGFAGLAILQWGLLLVQVLQGKQWFQKETVAFLLCSIGLGAVASVRQGEVIKQVLAVALGVMTYLGVVWSMRTEVRAKRTAAFAAVLGVGLLVLTLIWGEEVYGAKNWLRFGALSLQPAELCKICFLYGALVFSKRWDFGIYTAVIFLLLLLMNDLGTAMVFVAGFLTVMYLRHGGWTAGAGLTVLGTGAIAAGKLAPHVVRRFAVWRHIWEQPLTGGYQQTRGLMCIASGGLFGLGMGNGRMGSVFAADSDMVFATVSESFGLLLALVGVVGLMVLLVSAAQRGDLLSCTAAVMLCAQGAMNVLGAVDVLPMTGVVLPFVSNGGTGMVAAWGLLGFLEREEEENWRSGRRL